MEGVTVKELARPKPDAVKLAQAIVGTARSDARNAELRRSRLATAAQPVELSISDRATFPRSTQSDASSHERSAGSLSTATEAGRNLRKG